MFLYYIDAKIDPKVSYYDYIIAYFYSFVSLYRDNKLLCICMSSSFFMHYRVMPINKVQAENSDCMGSFALCQKSIQCILG